MHILKLRMNSYSKIFYIPNDDDDTFQISEEKCLEYFKFYEKDQAHHKIVNSFRYNKHVIKTLNQQIIIDNI